MSLERIALVVSVLGGIVSIVKGISEGIEALSKPGMPLLYTGLGLLVIATVAGYVLSRRKQSKFDPTVKVPVFSDSQRRVAGISLGIVTLCVAGWVGWQARELRDRSLSPPPTPMPNFVLCFNIYTDAGAPDNHFFPTGKMGDVGDITVIEAWTVAPHSGTSAIRIIYDAQGRGDEEGFYKCSLGERTPGPCKWAGLYWLNPADNFGTIKGAGFDLTGFKRLTFWSRTDSPAPVWVKFLVGGVGWGMATPPPHPDSLKPPRESGWKELSDAWQFFEIDLTDADLSYIIGGFAWVANWDILGITEDNPRKVVFYLDDIRFER